jgi:cell division protein FtsB
LRFFKQRIAHLDSEISVLEEKNRNLMEEIEALKKDPFYLEKLAREMGFVKEGEVIYKVTGIEKEENNNVSEETEQK